MDNADLKKKRLIMKNILFASMGSIHQFFSEFFSIENKISVEKSIANFLSLNLSLYEIGAQQKQMMKTKSSLPTIKMYVSISVIFCMQLYHWKIQMYFIHNNMVSALPSSKSILRDPLHWGELEIKFHLLTE